ncbi:c-type cytochrome biogenesis protein CcmI [Blastochloris tepida]|uniref:C-type cytochrome biogenesis protein CcmI n=1 Tax=Blastochloris tepida TaxID=2233851 RepID=A0A348G1X1_9HYPH|nr:c-type cytochrome biogenesis protein CcmI [Blastochloris tepida]BBF93554.1 c-type cytochrome biogenesis protein CcmI [Blastochloris tepida]
MLSFWVAIAVMTGVAALAVLVPLLRRQEAAAAPDLAVYRDQLSEIERDLKSGLISADEGEAARIEVKRRLLAAADRSGAEGAAKRGRRKRWALVFSGLVFVPMLSIGAYFIIGVPEMPDQPLAARLQAPADHQNFAALVQQVEARLAQNPDDGRGWELLAPVYLRSGRYQDAVKARQNALRLLGATADREADLGEALFAAGADIVTADSRAAFERALTLDPKQPKAHYFLGVAEQQAGNVEAAAARWRALLAASPPDAPWRSVVEQSLVELATATQPQPDKLQSAAPQSASPHPDKPLPGPRVENAARLAEQQAEKQAGELPPEVHLSMIRAMVEVLEQKLKTDTGDVEGWMRLVRSHMVLGDSEKAKTALASARTALAGDADKLKRLDDYAKELGLGG